MKKTWIFLFVVFIFQIFLISGCANSTDEPKVAVKTEETKDNKSDDTGSKTEPVNPDTPGTEPSTPTTKEPATTDPATPAEPEPAPVIKYTISFYANSENATGSTESITAEADSTIKLTANGFSLTGFKFVGWNTAADGSGTGFSDEASFKLISNLTLYAQWLSTEVPTYTIGVAPLEHGIVSLSQTIAEAGTEISITVTPDELYGLENISVISSYGQNLTYINDIDCPNIYKFSMPEENVTITIGFIQRYYKVSFVTNCLAEIPSQLIEIGSLATAPNYPTSSDVHKYAMYAKDWYTDIECKNQFNFNTQIIDNLTLYAKWDLFYISTDKIIEKIDNLHYSCQINISGLCDSNLIREINKALKRLYESNTEINVYLKLSVNNLEDASSENSFNSFYKCLNIRGLYFDKLLSVGNSSFEGCTNLETVNFFPSTPNFIGDNAFKDCKNLIKIKIPNSVTSIGNGAFSGCSSLEEMTIPFVGNAADITSPDTRGSGTPSTLFGFIFGTNSYTGGTATKQKYNGINNNAYATYYIPSSLKKVTVTGGTLFYGAFHMCKFLTDIIIEDDVEIIGNAHFSSCRNLNNISLPSNLKKIGSSMFLYCENLTNISIPLTVKAIDECAFEGSGITSITIPEGVTYISRSCFERCQNLSSVVIPASVDMIEATAFLNCDSLISISFLDTSSEWKLQSENENIGKMSATDTAYNANLILTASSRLVKIK